MDYFLNNQGIAVKTSGPEFIKSRRTIVGILTFMSRKMHSRMEQFGFTML